MKILAAGTRQLPIHHVTIRVPWYDDGWSRNVCGQPLANTSCLALPRIGEGKRGEVELRCAGQCLDELDPGDLQPCVGERVSFMAPFEIVRTMRRPYTESSAEHFRGQVAHCTSRDECSALYHLTARLTVIRLMPNTHRSLACGTRPFGTPPPWPELGRHRVPHNRPAARHGTARASGSDQGRQALVEALEALVDLIFEVNPRTGGGPALSDKPSVSGHGLLPVIGECAEQPVRGQERGPLLPRSSRANGSMATPQAGAPCRHVPG